MLSDETEHRWEHWQGQTFGGAFPLERLLAGSDSGAVFLTEFEGRPAAIKLIPDEDAESRLARWRAVSKLAHPNLLRIFRFGRSPLGESSFLYLVTEYAEENLAQVVPERPLTAVEAREMLEPVLSALGYLHAEGLVHGYLKPANILSVDDHLKISVDGIAPAGTDGWTQADDVRALGATLVETLTQKPPEPSSVEGLSNPFRDVARHCLEPDPQNRWTIADIQSRLGFRSKEPQRRKKQTYLPIGAVMLGVVVLVIAAGLTRPWWMPSSQPSPAPVKTAEAPPQPAPAAASTPAPAAESAPPRAAEKAPLPRAEPKSSRHKGRTGPEAAGDPAPASTANGPAPPGVANEVMPDIPRKARNTIHGKLTVNVRVHVDPAGHVTEASIIPPNSSKYFDGLTLKAVRRWQFHPTANAQEWTLRFDFFRGETKVFPERAGR